MLQLLLALSAFLVASSTAAEGATSGCPEVAIPYLPGDAPTRGPLRLEAVHCVEFRPGHFPISDPIVSPDGRYIARWHAGMPAPIEIASLNSPQRVQIPNRVSFRSFGSIISEAPVALAWADDSQSLWAVQQAILAPSGFATAGLSPISISRAGEVRERPNLRHPSGPLDGILWIGGNGLGLAQFGTRGDYYRPEHDDASPALAMVDAGRGHILDSLLISRLPGAAERRRSGGAIGIQGAAATILADGRIRAVVQLSGWTERVDGEHVRHPGAWVIWTQGEPPQSWQPPYPTDRANPIALSPDGSKLLVVRPLVPEGIVVACRVAPCPQPKPIPLDGTLAALHEVESGKVLWTLSGRAAERRGSIARPEISEDGRYGLIALPPENERRLVALVSMADGQLIQMISATSVHSDPQTFGFEGGTHDVWIAAGNVVRRYDFIGG